MKRILLAAAVACLGAYGAHAASPKIESAIKAIQAIATDPGKLKTFCEMAKAMDAMGDKDDPAAEDQIMALMKQLGPDFETAWNASDELDEKSEDGEAYNTAMDDLSAKCSG